MRSPLAEQTILQGRYRLLTLMAEGGFARTYLAEDQGRFHEKCVVKEFCLNSSDATIFEKSQELFQREAQTLYKLKHPQIPKFRALFTEILSQEKRVFLVQDYVEGQTYRVLLRQRLKAGQKFSEAEIRQLLTQLLPVLSYVHEQNIIHRDLSPENLILRTLDQLPVLIDFGVVKTVVTQLQQTNILPMGTAVGKFGFAPIEQLQSGRAYPNSDLYSLAVCCLVLLTGKEPAQLLDDATAAWNWKPHTTLTNELATILDRMLAHKPSDRYSSANEVLNALQSLPAIPLSAPTPPSPPISPPSDIHTVAVSTPDSPREDRSRQQAVIPPVYQPKVYEPKTIASPTSSPPKLGSLIFTGLVTTVLTAVAVLFLMRYLSQRPWDKRSPPVSPTPAVEKSQSPQPSPTIRYSQALQIALGQSVTVQGNLQPGEAQVYRFKGSTGEELSAQLNGAGVTFSVLRSNLALLSPQSQGIVNWQGTLPKTDTYTVRVQNNPANSAQSFELALALSAPVLPEASPSPSASVSSVSPLPTPAAPTINEAALNLSSDVPLQQLDGQLAPAHIQRYSVPVKSGQVLSVSVLGDGAVTLTIRDAAGQPLNSAQNILNWEAVLPEPGVYQVDVVPVDGAVPTNFAVEIGLR
jgi:serine/threonine protein kinase